MERYNFKLVEEKWQKYWLENKTFKSNTNKDKELIAIFSLGLDLMPFKNSMIMFSFIILIFYLWISHEIFRK